MKKWFLEEGKFYPIDERLFPAKQTESGQTEELEYLYGKFLLRKHVIRF